MTVSGGTGLDSSATGNAVTLAIDSTVATLTGSQTLTNKSLTAPTLTGTATVASLDISGDIDVDGTTNLDATNIVGALDVTGSVTATDGSTITVTDNSDVLTLISTDADENSGPRLALTRNSASPADNDYVGLISFNGENSTSESIRMGMIRTQVLDVTDGSEDSTLTFYSMHGGTETQRLATTSTGIDVTGTATLDSATPDLILSSPAQSWSGGEDMGGISWYTKDTSGTGPANVARIHGESSNSNTLPNVSLRFQTGVAGSISDRFVIAYDGSLSTPTLGTSNVRFGVNAGNSIASGGNYNVVVGDEAGTAITTGDWNTALGYLALSTEDTGSRATALGTFRSAISKCR